VIERGPLRIDLKRVTASWTGRASTSRSPSSGSSTRSPGHPGHVKNREQLMGEARMVVDDSTITSHVKRIRRKLTALDPGFDRIESVYGMGYRWREE
jgi:two-component system OmpR family response regulator